MVPLTTFDSFHFWFPWSIIKGSMCVSREWRKRNSPELTGEEAPALPVSPERQYLWSLMSSSYVVGCSVWVMTIESSNTALIPAVFFFPRDLCPGFWLLLGLILSPSFPFYHQLLFPLVSWKSCIGNKMCLLNCLFGETVKEFSGADLGS